MADLVLNFGYRTKAMQGRPIGRKGLLKFSASVSVEASPFRSRSRLSKNVDAANDVFCAVQLYRRLCGLAEAEGIQLDFAQLLSDLSVRINKTGKLISQWKTRTSLPEIVSEIEEGVQMENAETGNDEEKKKRPRRSGEGPTPRQKEAWSVNCTAPWSINFSDYLASIQGIMVSSKQRPRSGGNGHGHQRRERSLRKSGSKHNAASLR